MKNNLVALVTAILSLSCFAQNESLDNEALKVELEKRGLSRKHPVMKLVDQGKDVSSWMKLPILEKSQRASKLDKFSYLIITKRMRTEKRADIEYDLRKQFLGHLQKINAIDSIESIYFFGEEQVVLKVGTPLAYKLVPKIFEDRRLQSDLCFYRDLPEKLKVSIKKEQVIEKAVTPAPREKPTEPAKQPSPGSKTDPQVKP